MIYILCVLLLGVPVMCAEFIIGRKSKSDTVDAFKKLIPGSRWYYIGYIGILASILILGYYMVISGWTLEYLFQAACNNLTGKTAANAFIQNDFRPLLWIYIFLFINYIIISKGVQKGIEKMSNILMPILFIILIVFCIRSLTLPEANEGLKFFLHPDFSKITPQVIVRAMGQAFFSLSLGMGILITYSSYFNNKTHLIKKNTNKKTSQHGSDTRHNRCHSGRSNYIPGCFLLWCGSCRRSRSCICHPPQCIQSNAGICVMVCIVFLTPHCGSSYFHRFSFRSCSCIFYQPHASVKEKGNPDNDDHCCHIKHYFPLFLFVHGAIYAFLGKPYSMPAITSQLSSCCQ